MANIVLEGKWQNSRGGIDGWSFALDGDIVHWSYTQVQDARLDEVSWGEASFDLVSFRRLLVDFQQSDEASLTVPGGGSIALRRLSNGTIDLLVRAARGDSFACTFNSPRPGVLVPLGIDLAVKVGHA